MGSSAGTPATRKLVIYTVLIGAKESLRNPLVLLPPDATTDLELDFVCLSDNAALQSPVWRIQPIGDRHLPAEKLSRRPKAMPHEYFADAEYSLYIDNTVEFKRLPQASDLTSPHEGLFRAFKHSTRTDPAQEAAVLVTLGYEDVDTVCRQMDFYAAQRPINDVTPLTTGTVLLRQHHHPLVRDFGRLWWESILAFSKRDQLSLDYARQQARVQIHYFDGITRENDFVHWHGSYAQHRVKANFDARRYAWLHRDDPAAVADPRGHFLAHGYAACGGDDSAYLREAPVLDYLCWKHASSLGSHVAPRRQMAATLESLLKPVQGPGVTHLLVRVRGGEGPRAFSDAELEAATHALGVLVSPSGSLVVLDIEHHQIAHDSKVLAVPPPGFDVVVVLGAAGTLLPQTVAKLCHMARRDTGLMLVAMTGPAPLQAAAATEALLAKRWGAQDASQVQASLHASRHDDQRDALPNTVFALRWTALQAAAALPAVEQAATST